MLNRLSVFGALLVLFRVQALKLSVYYESLCPDSKKFITEQLYPNYQQLNGLISLDLVPFGNAVVELIDGKWNFTCQHGPNECYGNKIHSCAISTYPEDRSTEFVYCSMNATNPSSDETLQQCSEEASISWDALQECYDSGKGDELLAANGKKTYYIEPPISWVPTVVFDDEFDQTLQDVAMDDLLRAICDAAEDALAVCEK